MTKAKVIKAPDKPLDPFPVEVVEDAGLPGELKRFRCPFCTVQIGDKAGGCEWCKPVKAKLVF